MNVERTKQVPGKGGLTDQRTHALKKNGIDSVTQIRILTGERVHPRVKSCNNWDCAEIRWASSCFIVMKQRANKYREKEAKQKRKNNAEMPRKMKKINKRNWDAQTLGEK